MRLRKDDDLKWARTTRVNKGLSFLSNLWATEYKFIIDLQIKQEAFYSF